MLACCLFAAGIFPLSSVYSAIIGLDLEVSFGLFLPNDDPLPDGSTVYVIASPNASGTPLGPTSWGNALISDSTQGGETIIATFALDSTTFSGVPGEGTHAQAWSGLFDTDQFAGIYLRFFNSPLDPVGGQNIAWGQTDIIAPYDISFGFAFFDFDQKEVADQTNNFVVIPEPGTMSLMVLAAAILFGWVHLRRTQPLAVGNMMPDHFDKMN